MSRVEPRAEGSFRGRIHELDGLRAAGTILVLLNHLWPRALSPVVWDVGLLAWIAMDSFFVLSGFLIAGVLLDARDAPDYYRSYYRRRALRIFPLYYLVLAWLTGTALFWKGGDHYARLLETWGSPFWFFVYLGNVKVAIAGAWPTVAGLTPLWSLQVEEQFYLLLPPAIRRLRLRTLVATLWGLVIVSPALRLAIYLRDPGNPYPQYVLLPCHMEGLALGALIALRFRSGPWDVRKGRLGALTLVLLAGTCALSVWSNPLRLAEEHSSPFNRTAGYLLSSLACASLVTWLVAFRGSTWTSWLRTPPMRYLGKISYGVYLLHVPVREAIYHLRNAMGWTLPRESLPMVLVVVLASVASASLSWHLLERPILGLKERTGSSGSSRSS